MDWNDLTQDMDQWRALVKSVYLNMYIHSTLHYFWINTKFQSLKYPFIFNLTMQYNKISPRDPHLQQICSNNKNSFH
jgi:hypothetical protein